MCGWRSSEFGVLGPLRVAIDGAGEIPVLPPKQRVLLARLLLSANHIVPLQALIDVVWDDRPPRSARITTQGYIKDLRLALQDTAKRRIVTAEPGYLIVIRDDELDLNTFARLSDQARAAFQAGDWAAAADKLTTALGLWRGEPLLDIPSAMLQRDEVPALTETRLQALELRIDADLHLGRHAQLVPELRRMTGAHPLREKFHAQLMLALFRSGQQAEAIDSYQRVRKLLSDEVGILPGAVLRDLHRRMLAGDPALRGTGPARTPDPPRQLPGAVPDFTGRDAHVKHLTEVLHHSTSGRRAVVISAVTGAGGVGKTALALHVAHSMTDAFPDGQLYASLQGTTVPVDPRVVLARFLSDLGLPNAAIPVDEEALAARYRTLMAGRRMLVVLDDARGAAQVRPLLPGGPDCAVLITSRAAITELPGATLIDLDVLEDGEARELFSVIVGPARTAAEPEATRAVLGFCAGLPLAIRVAATRLVSRPAWTIASLTARLVDEHGRLDELSVGDVAIRSTFAVSYQALPADGAAEIFPLLGLAGPGSVSLGAAAALAGWREPRARRALETLLDSHLAEGAGACRYRVHDLLRIYAAELAERMLEPGVRDAAVRRMLRWYCQRAIAANGFETGAYAPPGDVQMTAFASRREAMEWCEAERANLVAATGRAAELGMDDVAAGIPAALWSFFQRRPYQADWLVTHATGLESARRSADIYTEGYLLQSLGKCHIRFGRFDKAYRCLTSALALRNERGDLTGEARTLATMGHAYLSFIQPEIALVKLTEALGFSAHLTDADIAIICNNVGEALRQLRRHDEAIPHLERAVALARQAGDRYCEGIAETTTGEVVEAMGATEDAVTHYSRALAAHQDSGPGDVEGAYVLCHLARVYGSLGRAAEAADALRAALPALDRLGDPQAAVVRDQLVMSGTIGN